MPTPAEKPREESCRSESGQTSLTGGSTKRQCRACGEVGHTKRSKECHLYTTTSQEHASDSNSATPKKPCIIFTPAEKPSATPTPAKKTSFATPPPAKKPKVTPTQPSATGREESWRNESGQKEQQASLLERVAREDTKKKVKKIKLQYLLPLNSTAGQSSNSAVMTTSGKPWVSLPGPSSSEGPEEGLGRGETSGRSERGYRGPSTFQMQHLWTGRAH